MHIAEFQSFLRRRGNGPSTIKRKLNSLKPFFANCKTWNLVSTDLNQGWSKVKVEKGIGRKVWSEAEIVETVQNLGAHAGDMYLFLAETSLRSNQGFTLTFGQWDRSRKTITVSSTKGGVKRTYSVAISDAMNEFLEQKFEFAHRQARGKNDDTIFLNTRGKRWSRNAFANAVRLVARDLLGFDGLVPYGLRHTFITELEGKRAGCKSTVACRACEVRNDDSVFENHERGSVTRGSECEFANAQTGLRYKVTVRSQKRKKQKGVQPTVTMNLGKLLFPLQKKWSG